MQDCIFCKIVKGDIPSHKVYEDESVVAFLDIHPIQAGHTLVIPKKHEPHLDNLDDGTYQQVMSVLKKVSIKLKEVTGSDRACVRVEGFDVPHAHIHAYPCNSPEDFYGDKDRLAQEPDHEALTDMASKLKIEFRQ